MTIKFKNISLKLRKFGGVDFDIVCVFSALGRRLNSETKTRSWESVFWWCGSASYKWTEALIFHFSWTNLILTQKHSDWNPCHWLYSSFSDTNSQPRLDLSGQEKKKCPNQNNSHPTTQNPLKHLVLISHPCWWSQDRGHGHGKWTSSWPSSDPLHEGWDNDWAMHCHFLFN